MPISSKSQRQKFYEWLKLYVNEKGTHYAENTIVAYTQALASEPSRVEGVKLPTDDVYGITSLEEYRDFYKLIMTATNLEQIKQRRKNNDFEQSLKLYGEFLQNTSSKKSLKEGFYSYIGSTDSLAGYVRSYKLVFLKCLLDCIDATGKALAYQVASKFRDFYVERKLSGKLPDVKVDARIGNAEVSSVAEVLSVIEDNPYKVISNKGYIKKREYDGENYFVFAPDLFSELSHKDIEGLKDILDKKLQLYYERVEKETKTSDIHALFYQIMENYFVAKTSQSFTGNTVGELFRKKAPSLFQKLPFFDSDTYLVKGSVGQGNWASVPWICIFDKRITTTAQRGEYIVYLLSEDGKTLYLTFNQGCTEYKNNLGKRQALLKMKEIASDIRSKLPSNNFACDNDFTLGNEFYEQGCILYRAYSKENLPENHILISDLKDMLALYQVYYEMMSEIEEAGDIGTVEEESKVMNEYIVSDEIARISQYITSKGFSYEDGLIENFYLSLKSKPFVILAGISGTGKTKLVKLFAESLGATADNGRYKLVPVRPDWSDSTDLFGHVDLNGTYICGVLTKFIKAAVEEPTKPYFLCLDEMNLARVEYYLSDVLSVVETRRKAGERIVTDSLISEEAFGLDNEARREYGTLYLPENLYIVGTVNMDETTFPFSKKVLDRANTIELSHVDLDIVNSIGKSEVVVLDNSFLKSEYLLLGECSEYEETNLSAVSLLKQMNQVLSICNAQIGYRVRDEICFYLMYNDKYTLLDVEMAMDYCILQKILPRLQGSGNTMKRMLCELFKICTGNQATIELSDSGMIGDKMLSYVEAQDNIPYRRSATKLAFMTRRYEEDGYTSYWI